MKKKLLENLKKYFDIIKYTGYAEQSISESILILKFVSDILQNPDLELYISDEEFTIIYNLLEYINLKFN